MCLTSCKHDEGSEVFFFKKKGIRSLKRGADVKCYGTSSGRATVLLLLNVKLFFSV